jgi:hypothetical protein
VAKILPRYVYLKQHGKNISLPISKNHKEHFNLDELKGILTECNNNKTSEYNKNIKSFTYSGISFKKRLSDIFK